MDKLFWALQLRRNPGRPTDSSQFEVREATEMPAQCAHQPVASNAVLLLLLVSLPAVDHCPRVTLVAVDHKCMFSARVLDPRDSVAYMRSNVRTVHQYESPHSAADPAFARNLIDIPHALC
jgi:hypothetical protein